MKKKLLLLVLICYAYTPLHSMSKENPPPTNTCMWSIQGTWPLEELAKDTTHVSLQASEGNQEIDPDTIARLRQIPPVEVLELQPFSLFRLPEIVRHWTPRLQTLSLKTTTGEDYPVVPLPPCIAKLTGLIKLTLVGQQLTELPDDLSSLQMLRELDLRNNSFQQVPSALFALTALEKLDLSHNNLETLPSGLSTLRRLRKLKLQHNALRGNEVLSVLSRLTRLTTLDLSDSFSQLPDKWKSLLHIVELSLDDSALLSALTQPTSLPAIKALKISTTSDVRNTLKTLLPYLEKLFQLQSWTVHTPETKKSASASATNWLCRRSGNNNSQ